ncbi:hypothetical protein D3C85_1764160 [compost metagenome]
MFIDLYRLLDGLDETATQRLDFLLGTDIGEYQYKLVPPNPGDKISVANTIRQAARHLVKHQITCSMP